MSGGGLFASDPASCNGGGMANPLTSLSKHSDSNNRFFNNQGQPQQQQQQQQQYGHNNDVFNNSNRFLKIDNHLEQEFTAFHQTSQTGAVYGGGDSNSRFAATAAIIPQQQQQPMISPLEQPIFQQHHHHHQPQQHHQQNGRSGQYNWTNEFSRMSLSSNPITNTNGQAVHNTKTGLWHEDFMRQQQHNIQRVNTIPTSTNILSHQHQQLPRSSYMSEHQEIHHHHAVEQENNNKEFNTLFDQIEAKMALKPEEEEMEVKNSSFDYDRDNFAKTAKLVADVMTKKAITSNTNTTKPSLMSKKFENSNFLKLMSQVSNKAVVINDKGDGFMENTTNTTTTTTSTHPV